MPRGEVACRSRCGYLGGRQLGPGAWGCRGNLPSQGLPAPATGAGSDSDEAALVLGFQAEYGAGGPRRPPGARWQAEQAPGGRGPGRLRLGPWDPTVTQDPTST